MKLFPAAAEPPALGDGTGVLFWYAATHIAQAQNSRRYRIENRMEQLPGARSFVGPTLTAQALAGVRLVLVIRPFVDTAARRQLEALRAAGVAVWADYDDLLFDCPLDEWPGAERFFKRLQLRRRMPLYRSGLDAFDAFTCTTEPIAAALRRLRPGAPVHLVANVPSPAWIERGWARYGHLARQPDGPQLLRYLPGSPSHDADFAVIEDELAAYLHAHPRVELEIVGYLHFRAKKFPRERVRHRPKVPYEEFPAVLLSTWINLIPLAPTAYSQARSNIKWLEAEAFGVTSVARVAELPP